MIALDGATKRYAGKVVLAPTTLRVTARSSLALLGPSGCGKSTILRLILGLILPDSGRIVVGTTLVTPSSARNVRLRTGYVVQEGGLFPHLSARDNAAVVARHLRWPASRISARIAELSDLLRLERTMLHRYPSELSGGQRQRVGIMRALMLDPDVLLLDEPMGALDPMVRAALQRDLKPIFTDYGKTVVLVTHDLQEAATLGDRVALMRAGQIVQYGTMNDLTSSPKDDFVRAFVEAQRTPCV